MALEARGPILHTRYVVIIVIYNHCSAIGLYRSQTHTGGDTLDATHPWVGYSQKSNLSGLDKYKYPRLYRHNGGRAKRSSAVSKKRGKLPDGGGLIRDTIDPADVSPGPSGQDFLSDQCRDRR